MDTHSWRAVMQAEDLDRRRQALDAAEATLAEAVGPASLTQQQSLSAPNPESRQRAIGTAASLGIGSEYGPADVDTASYDKLAAIIQLAQYAGVDFRECVREGLWQHGCNVIDDGSQITIPRDLILQADELGEDLAGVGIDAAPKELCELGERLDRRGVLEISEKEASVLAAVRDALTARVETTSAGEGDGGNG